MDIVNIGIENIIEMTSIISFLVVNSDSLFPRFDSYADLLGEICVYYVTIVVFLILFSPDIVSFCFSIGRLISSAFDLFTNPTKFK